MYMRLFVICGLISLTLSATAQQAQVDTLRNWVSHTSNDTLKIVWLENIARIYAEINPDSAYHSVKLDCSFPER